MNCVICNKVLTGKQRMYCSGRCKSESHGHSYKCQQERADKRKRDLVKLKGGKCQMCGYSKNLSALCFHHATPSLKTMKLDSRTLSGSSWERILKESDQCELLCSNCHMEVHNPHANLED